MFTFCHSCGQHFSSHSFIVYCPDCNSEDLSVKIIDDFTNDLNTIGYVVLMNNTLVWTEFIENKTFIYSLRKNFSIVPTISIDFKQNIINDPITNTSIKIGLNND